MCSSARFFVIFIIEHPVVLVIYCRTPCIYCLPGELRVRAKYLHFTQTLQTAALIDSNNQEKHLHNHFVCPTTTEYQAGRKSGESFFAGK